MSLIKEDFGCKVGWATYDNEAEAIERAGTECVNRDRKLSQGYDFGYQWPGSIDHHEATDTQPERWTVTLA